MPALIVQHNQAANRFQLEVDGQVAVADYHLEGNRMIFTHTEVPPALRGGGIAAQLVKAALEEASRGGRRVVPLCSYVARYIERHPEFEPLVDKDF